MHIDCRGKECFSIELERVAWTLRKQRVSRRRSQMARGTGEENERGARLGALGARHKQ